MISVKHTLSLRQAAAGILQHAQVTAVLLLKLCTVTSSTLTRTVLQLQSVSCDVVLMVALR